MILSARWILPITSKVISNGAIVIQGNKIKDFGLASRILNQYPNETVYKYPGSAILPGLINVHSHLELTILRGYLENLGFWDWIKEISHVKYKVLTLEDIGISSLLGACEAIRSGVTTLGDVVDLGPALDAFLQSGLRGIIYQEMFSPVNSDASRVMEELKNKLKRHKKAIINFNKNKSKSIETFKSRLTLGISPHSPYTVSPTLFDLINQFSELHQMPVCIHIAESIEETNLIMYGTGPISDGLVNRGIEWKIPGCTPVEYLDRLGLLSNKVLLVHCIQLEASDYDVLKKNNVSVAYCPKSNFKLRTGFMNLNKMLQKKIKVGLGTDSVASNNNMDLFEEMRMAVFNPSWLETDGNNKNNSRKEDQFGAYKALKMATLGGALTLGLSDSIGSIEIGKKADLISVDLSKAHTRPTFCPVTTLVFAARGADVNMTMVDGKFLFKDNQILTFNESKLYESVEVIEQRLKRLDSD